MADEAILPVTVGVLLAALQGLVAQSPAVAQQRVCVGWLNDCGDFETTFLGHIGSLSWGIPSRQSVLLYDMASAKQYGQALESLRHGRC